MKSRLLLFGFTFFPAFLFACSCLYYTNFCEAMTPSSQVASLRVIDTYLIDDDGYSVQFIDAVVLDELVGNAPADTLSIEVAHSGFSCSPGVNLAAYAIGDTVITYVEFDVNLSPHGYPSFYAPFGCSEGLLFVTAAGIDYEAFKANIDECIETTVDISEKQLAELVHIFPSPVRTDLNIYIDAPLDLKISVFAANGQSVYQNNSGFTTNFEINVANWANGIYIIRLQSGGQQLVQRFLKN